MRMLIALSVLLGASPILRATPFCDYQSNPCAFIYRSGSITGFLPNNQGIAEAWGINDAGDIVGLSSNDSGIHGFLYNAGGPDQDLL